MAIDSQRDPEKKYGRKKTQSIRIGEKWKGKVNDSMPRGLFRTRLFDSAWLALSPNREVGNELNIYLKECGKFKSVFSNHFFKRERDSCDWFAQKIFVTISRLPSARKRSDGIGCLSNCWMKRLKELDIGMNSTTSIFIITLENNNRRNMWEMASRKLERGIYFILFFNFDVYVGLIWPGIKTKERERPQWSTDWFVYLSSHGDGRIDQSLAPSRNANRKKDITSLHFYVYYAYRTIY